MPDSLHRDYLTPDGIALYVCSSSSEPGLTHYPIINIHTTEADCTCKHFTLQLAPAARRKGIPITIDHPRYRCKHINAATNDCFLRKRRLNNLETEEN
jgi:hypothetical protein